jgi:thioester reductase-like protein
MAHILLTGGTGALGSSILRLLTPHHTVSCLARAKGAQSAHERIFRLVENTARLNVIEGDITKPHCGLSEATLKALEGTIDMVVHCAASIDFANELEAMTANVVGLTSVLDVAQRLNIKDFRHVSTAYVAGDSTRFSEHDLDAGQKLRNPYEQSKWTGERLVHTWSGG